MKLKGFKFQISDQNKQISKQNEIENEIEELRNLDIL